MTIILSASETVPILCETIIETEPSVVSERFLRTCASVLKSSAEKVSSKM